MAHNFIELDKAVVHVISLFSFLCGFHSVCPLRIRIRGLYGSYRVPETDWGKLGLVLMGGGILSKSLFQFSVDEQGCVPFLFFGLRPNYGRDNGDLLHKGLCQHCYIQYP